MGHDKLRKFAENETFSCLLQPEAGSVLDKSEATDGLRLKNHPIKGHWNEKMFTAAQPIVLELGCGKGEYTIDLSRREPSLNYIGVDIKGARLWKGAKFATENHLPNVAFLRTSIELIAHFFAPGEVAEIWITFPDPQMKKVNKRLTGTRFMRLYRQILAGDGIIHLKTDSQFMYTYTAEMVKANQYPVLFQTDDLYHSNGADEILSIKTYYEQQWLDRGLNIKYIRFVCEERETLIEPDVEIEYDAYRSFNRSKRSALASGK